MECPIQVDAGDARITYNRDASGPSGYSTDRLAVCNRNRLRANDLARREELGVCCYVVGRFRVKIPSIEALERRGSHPGMALGAQVKLREQWERASNVSNCGSTVRS
jgi:hypothetical protein